MPYAGLSNAFCASRFGSNYGIGKLGQRFSPAGKRVLIGQLGLSLKLMDWLGVAADGNLALGFGWN